MNQNEVKWEDTPNCCPIPWEIFLSIHIKSRGTRILPWHWCRLLNLLQHLITLSVEKHTDFHVIFDLQWREIKSFFFCLRTFTVAPTSPALTSQPWRNLEAIPPLRRSGSLLTRSITLCLFQLKLTPFAVKSLAIPCRKVTHPCNTGCPGGFSVSGCILCCYKKIYTVKRRSKGWTSKALPAGKMCAWHMCVCSQMEIKSKMSNWWFESHLILQKLIAITTVNRG